MGQTSDHRRYANDKPKSCEYCYFWRGKHKGCERSECFYLLPEETEKSMVKTASEGAEPLEEESCEGCPYGKYSPCIGYCLEQIIRELKVRRYAK